MSRIRALISIVLCACPPGAGATTFAVTRVDDPLPNGCQVGDCSLREAVLGANANGDSDVIQLPSGTFVLTRGTLAISNPVQLRGSTTTPTIIDGDGAQPLFNVTGSPTVLLANMSLQAHGVHALDLSRNALTTLDQVIVPNSDSQIWADSLTNGSGSLEIRRSEIRAYLTCGRVALCRISDSSLLRLQVGDGDDAATRVELTRVIVDGSLAADGSGVVMQTTGAVSVIDSTITQTDIGLLFAAAAPSQVSIDALSFVDNAGPLRVNRPAPVSVMNSEFRSNTSSVSGGGPGAIHAQGGSNWTIDGSTFDRNSGSGSVGGAVLVETGALMQLRNSTFSGNSFTVAAAGAGARGAAIGYRSDAAGTSVVLRNVTLVRPAFAPVGIIGTLIGGTGAEAGLILNVYNSILSGSCALEAAAIDANIGNIESPGDSCDLAAANNTLNVANATLALGSLANHGGPTDTFEPAPTSPAINTANAALCPAIDQRNYVRPFGGGCDIGSTEVGSRSEGIFADGFE